jgi:hypothetical protein
MTETLKLEALQLPGLLDVGSNGRVKTLPLKYVTDERDVRILTNIL